MNEEKMKIEIWSDIACPFCFIGKRQLENALKEFPHSNQIEVEWKSFLLDPSIPKDANQSLSDYFINTKGLTLSQVEKLTKRIQNHAHQAGLDFNYDRAIAANTLNAHRLSHLAKTKSAELQNRAEDLLFKAYFIEGKNVNEMQVLIEIGTQLGLEAKEVEETIMEQRFSEAIRKEGEEATTLGIPVIPHLILNKQQVISGVQTEEKLLQIVEKAYQEWKENKTSSESTIIQGSSCSIDGHCE